VSTLPLTGERTLPGIWHENYWFRRHEAAYSWVTRHLDVAGGVVLEAGVGEGYGGQALADAGAALVLGLDLDRATLRHVGRAHPGVAPVCANLVALPVRDRGVDLVVSSQVVEHLWDQETFVAECARVLRPGGRLVVTTPNRRTFPPGNPFHSRELDAVELAALLAAQVEVEAVHGVHHGARLAALDAVHAGLVEAQLAGTPDTWREGLRSAVASVTAGDFAVGGADGGLDLVAVGVRR
jgi:2-polyprenyl-3-methyl-5-hydroxy-6-metoxy-1,4-benzoquinol methylase